MVLDGCGVVSVRLFCVGGLVVLSGVGAMGGGVVFWWPSGGGS